MINNTLEKYLKKREDLREYQERVNAELKKLNLDSDEKALDLITDTIDKSELEEDKKDVLKWYVNVWFNCSKYF